ncbi:MAG: VWA domain-containing protein [Pyrinomonadaceae bacterium]|nr:VWA domain-containing protein [Pyrinomonadaceae bacterium]
MGVYMLKPKSRILFSFLTIYFFLVSIFSQNTNDINTVIRVNVIDNERKNIMGLKAGNFEVKDGDFLQKITLIEGKEEPASVVMLMDISDSVSEIGKQAGADGLLKLVEASNPQNEYSIISFGKGETILADWGSSKNEVENAIAILKSSNTQVKDTKVEPALNLAIDKLSKRTNHKKFIIFYTDWVYKSYSKETIGEIKQKLQNSDIQLFQVVLLPPRKIRTEGFDFGTVGEPVDRLSLVFEDFEGLAPLSKGANYFTDKKEVVSKIFDQITEFIGNQYLIKFQPLGNKSKKTRIKVKVIGVKNINETIVRSSLQ